MKKTFVRFTAFSLFFAASVSLAGCSSLLGEQVDPGNVALLVSNYGDGKGIENAELFTGGRVRYNPVSQQYFEFPVYYKTFSFAKDGDKDSSINFAMSGSPVSMDVGVTYQFKYSPVDAKKPQYTWLHEFFRNYRVSPEAFNDGALRNGLRDCANEKASGLNPVSLSTKTAEFMQGLQECLSGKFPQIDIKEVSQLNPARLPEQIQASINRNFQAQQEAETAKSNLAKVEAESKVAIVKAQTEAQTNQLQAKSITPELIQWEKLQIERIRAEKWNGQSAPTIQTPNVQLGANTAQ